MLVMWLLPMIAERASDPLEFVESTIKGAVGYDSPDRGAKSDLELC